MQAEAHRRHAAGDEIGAVAIYKKLIKLQPREPQLLALLGEALTAMGLIDEARAALTKAMKLRPNDPALLYDLAMTYRREGRLDEAHRYLDKALALRPDDPMIVSAKSAWHYIAGDVETAYATLAPLLDRGQRHISLVLGFARFCHRLNREEEGIALLRECLARNDLPQNQRAEALFFMGDLHDRLGRYDEAFAAYAEANRLEAIRFNPEAFSRSVDDLIQLTWTAPRFKELPRSRVKTPNVERAVFILGMPRSGTSLVEQILASHPQVHGAGELDDIPRLVHEWQGAMSGAMPLMTDLEPLTQEAVEREAVRYLDRIKRLAPGAKRITNKMPLNCLHVGLISLLFPPAGAGAKIIHCVRDPMDTCLSCFFQNFGGHLPFAYDLSHLGLFYRDYQRIMRHWREVLDIPMLDVVYEDLVTKQETVSRRMVEFIGLDWNEACLRFHENKRVVLTMSNDQVRRPMYNASIGRWRKYEKHLSPLKEALGGT